MSLCRKLLQSKLYELVTCIYISYISVIGVQSMVVAFAELKGVPSFRVLFSCLQV